MPTETLLKRGYSTYDLRHYKQTEAYARQVQRLYDLAISEFARMAVRLDVDPEKPFSFKDYPLARREAAKIIRKLVIGLEKIVQTGIKEQWLFANQKNDAFLESILRTSKVPKEMLAKMQDRNLDALKTFQDRKIDGLNVSDRIWKQMEVFQQSMELALDVGIGEGRSAQQLSRDIRQNLLQPDKLFRRVRDARGQLQLSKAAKAYHPGRGVYRSSYKNAMRLTRTEVNMAYRDADRLRWTKLDFVVGFEVKLSNNHTLNGEPFRDICDDLAGKYPKWFVYKSWHPQCYSDDTEVMTDNGWKLFKDLTQCDLIFSLNPETKQPEYVKYVNYFTYYKEGKMIQFKNRALDMLVTEDHRMVYLHKVKKDILLIKSASDFDKYKGLLYRSSEYKAQDCKAIKIGKHVLPFDAYTEFMAYYLAEGSISWTRKNQFSIAQSKDKHSETYAKIEKVLSKLNLNYRALAERFYLCDHDLCEYLKRFGKSENKHVPEEIKKASPRQMSIFLDAYVTCDGHSRKSKPFVGNRGNGFKSEKDERMFFTSSDQMAGDIGELLVKIGRRPSYELQKIKGVAWVHRNGTYVGNKDLWRIRECYAQTATVFEKNYVDYAGYVYDIELERNHILYIRRNGKCVWGSNCRCFAIPILSDPTEFKADELNELRAAIKGTEYRKYSSKNEIKDVPEAFKRWAAENQQRVDRLKSTPYFIRDNFKGGRIGEGLKIASDRKYGL